jgi:hypothetical protein
MSEKLNCECCGMWTSAGKKHLAERSREKPIYGTDFSIPLSQTIEKLRSQLTNIRGQLGDINSAFPVWGERTKDVEGLLTCGIVTLYGIAKEMREFEVRQASPTASTSGMGGENDR